MESDNYFKGKKITVMRIGLLGRGIGDTAYLAEAGAEILVVDDATQEAMQSAVDALSRYKNVTFKFGPYDNADFTNVDFVLVGAGAPLDLPCLLHAKEQGIPLKQSAAWFAELSKVPIIGVTGTRGKSTVTHMIHHVLSFVTGEEVLLGGNVRGVSNLQLLKQVKDDSLCVMELDSWQLQGFGWDNISPQVAVFTNFMDDHLNYYERDGKTYAEAMDLYFKDKAQIFLHQEASGTLVTTPEVFERIKKKFPNFNLGQELILADASVIPEDCLLAMPGEHNRLNAALAYEALKSVGLDDEEVFTGLASFPGVPGRLQLVGEYEGIKIYNDNNATTPKATVVGIEALAKEKNLILLMGGADKGLDTSLLKTSIDKYVKKVFLLSGTGTDKIADEIRGERVESLREGVKAGLAFGQPGDIFLFSPAFASFGMFKNEYERNDEFMKMVNELEEKEKFPKAS